MSVPNRFAVGLAKAHGPAFAKTEFATDSPLEGTGLSLPVAARLFRLLDATSRVDGASPGYRPFSHGYR